MKKTLHIVLFSCLFIFGRTLLFSQSQNIIDSLFANLSISSSQQDTIKLAKAINLFGESLANQLHDDMAIDQFRSVISLFSENALIEELGYTYNNLGSIYSRNNDPGKAIQCTQKALSIFSHFLGKGHLYIGVIFKNIAVQKGALGLYDEKRLALLKSDSILSKHLLESNPRRLEIYRELGLSYIALGQMEKAEKTLSKLLGLVDQLPSEDQANRLSAYEAHTSLITRWSEKFSRLEILNTFQKYINRLEKSLGKGHSSLRNLYNNYAVQLSNDTSKYNLAINYFHLALFTKNQKINPNNYFEHPRFSMIKNPSLADLTLIGNKGSLMYQLFQQSQNEELIQSAFHLFMLGDTIAEQIKNAVFTITSRYIIKGDYKNFYTFFNTCCVILFNSTQERKYLDRLFENIEKMKHWELMESLISKDSENLVKIKNYSAISLNEVERFCQQNQEQWLHYFYLSPGKLATILITPDTCLLHVFAVPWDSIVHYQASLIETVIDKNWAFNKPAKLLYQHLIKPIEHHLKWPSLIITPFSSLRNLPFEMFIQNDFDTLNINLLHHHYLLNTFFIRYQHSASHGLMTLLKGAAIDDISFFAPQYNDPSQVLSWNLNEVKICQNIIGGRTIFSERNLFEKALNRSGIVHFAGHTVTDHSDSKKVYLILEKDSLFLEDIMLLETNTNLIVLSSCESAIGKSTIEALMGPAYGFALAGIPNIISTHWQINDRATANLFEKYYMHLKGQKSSSIALTEAKRSYLNQTLLPGRHPYYWASPVYYGQPLMYKRKKAFNNLWWVLFGALGIGVTFLIWQIRLQAI